MVRPFIYAVCDQRYYDLYASSFLNSVRRADHDVEVICDGKTANTLKEKIAYMTGRFIMLPEMLKKHPSVMILDIDCVVRKPIEIEPEYDLGLHLRPNKSAEFMKILACDVYFTDRAMEFAERVAKTLSTSTLWWSSDQLALWTTYAAIGNKFNIKTFGQEMLDWDVDTTACIYAGKGPRKHEPMFMEEVAKWRSPEAAA